MPATERPLRSSHRVRSRFARWTAAITAAGVGIAIANVAISPASSAAPPAGSQAIISDSFDRDIGAGWGSAPTGGSYLTQINGTRTTSNFSVTGGYGTVTMQPLSSFTATLPASSLDTHALASFRVPSLAAIARGLHYTVQMRVQTNGDAYRARVYVGGSGSVTLSFSRINGGADSGIGQQVVLPFRVVSGNELKLEVSATGTGAVALNSKAWLSSAAEPPAWQATFADSSSGRITGNGRVGLWSYLSGGSAFSLQTSGLQAWVPSVTPPPPPPPPPPVDPLDRGAGTVGSASFAIPASARFVAKSGSDSNAGTQAAPYRTLAAAVAKSPAGTTIVMRAGNYNESVTVDTANITIQNYPGEAVWLEGAIPVTNWARSGSNWISTGWTAEFDRSTSQTRGDTSTRWIRPEYPLASWPDQVFINGSQLTQVATAGGVGPGEFYVDYAANTLLIGSDPGGKSVMSSNLSRAMRVNSKGVTIQGVGIRHYGTSLPDTAAVWMVNTESSIRSVEFSDNATLSLSMTNNNATVDHVTIRRSGMMGLGMNAAYNSEITNSIISGNNHQNFKDAPVSGGFKMTRSRGVLVQNNEISENTSAGYWCDESCYDVDFVSNTVTDNTTAGIQLEISDTGLIADNTFEGNGNAVALINTGNVTVSNNDFGASTYYGVRLRQDSRRNSNTGLTGHDPRRPNPDLTVPWELSNIVVQNNVFSSGGRSQFYGMDGETNQSMDAVGVTINGNLFNSYSGSGTRMVGWGQGDNVTVVYYDTPAALAAAKNSGWRNAATGQQSLAAMLAVKASYNSTALPLPSLIATLLGKTLGSRHMGAF